MSEKLIEKLQAWAEEAKTENADVAHCLYAISGALKRGCCNQLMRHIATFVLLHMVIENAVDMIIEKAGKGSVPDQQGLDFEKLEELFNKL